MDDYKKECEACNEDFKWDDDVILVDDVLYHKDCVELAPLTYGAWVGDEYIGETENYDGSSAFEYLDFEDED